MRTRLVWTLVLASACGSPEGATVPPPGTAAPSVPLAAAVAEEEASAAVVVEAAPPEPAPAPIEPVMSPTPHVELGTPTASRGLDAEVVRRVVHRHINEVRFCFEMRLPLAHDLAGRVHVRAIIDAEGHVTEATVDRSTLGSDEPDAGGADVVEACIAEVTGRWTFPAPDGGGPVTIGLPWTLAGVPPLTPIVPHTSTIGMGTMGTIGS